MLEVGQKMFFSLADDYETSNVNDLFKAILYIIKRLGEPVAPPVYICGSIVKAYKLPDGEEYKYSINANDMKPIWIMRVK